jgi:hypothetical protein
MATARVLLGEPIDLKARLGEDRLRTLAKEVSEELEVGIEKLMK